MVHSRKNELCEISRHDRFAKINLREMHIFGSRKNKSSQKLFNLVIAETSSVSTENLTLCSHTCDENARNAHKHITVIIFAVFANFAKFCSCEIFKIPCAKINNCKILSQ